MPEYFQEVKDLTVELVSVRSVNKAPGEESAIAKHILGYYEKHPYFRENPGSFRLQKTKNDPIDRHNVIAYVRGTKEGGSDKTVILIGHIDTVGVDDFGEFADYATKPEELPELLKEHFLLSDEVLEDIASGDYLFGRGSLDMKSGVAGHMAIMKHFSEQPELLKGNIVAVHACDEEDSSNGIISALDVLTELKDECGFDYIACVNADYTTNRYPNDTNFYVYFGTIGKYLPGCSVFGKEAHAGQPFAAFDPNLLTAIITKNVSLNSRLSDMAQGELTVPPISLKQMDFKPDYSVQTALAAQVYYNVFSHGSGADKVIATFKEVVEESYDETLELMDRRYREYCERAGIDYTPLGWKRSVYTWEELCEELREKNPSFDKKIEEFKSALHLKSPDMDMRRFSHEVAQFAWNMKKSDAPGVVIYYGAILSAPIETVGRNEGERALIAGVEKALSETKSLPGRPIQKRFFYPYISDSSFMAVSGDRESHKKYIYNMPSWGQKYVHPFEKIEEVDVPVVNIGPQGKDGHMLSERVHQKYSFGVVPSITTRVLLELLKQ